MSLKSSSDKYGTVAVTIHWLSAFLIFALIASGFRASDMENLSAKADILKIHVPLGIAILFLTLARIVWWKFADKKPAPIAMPRLQDRAAHAIHVLFYVVILGMAASGIGMIILSGAGSIIFDGSGGTLPNFGIISPVHHMALAHGL